MLHDNIKKNTKLNKQIAKEREQAAKMEELRSKEWEREQQKIVKERTEELSKYEQWIEEREERWDKFFVTEGSFRAHQEPVT